MSSEGRRAEVALEEETLHLPLTRPNLFLMVPYGLAVMFGVAFFALDTEFHSWKLGFLVLPFWSGAAVLVRRDLNGVRVFLCRARLCLTLLDAWRWGGPSASPFHAKRAMRFPGIADAA
jgi:type IV secretory pathway VirB3-like protein